MNVEQETVEVDVKAAEEKLNRKIKKTVWNAINEYDMIQDGDKLMVCLSGGKDSYTMLDILMQIQKASVFNFEIIAVNLDQKQPGFPEEVLPKYLKDHPATVIGLLHLDLDLYQPTLDVLKIVKNHMAKGSVIVFDEINHDDYPGETLAVMKELKLNTINLKRVKEASMAGYTVL